MTDVVRSVLERAFPDRDVAAVEAAGTSWNAGNDTVEVDFADGESVYLKTATDGTASRIRRERAVLARIGAETSIPVPAVVAWDADGATPYLATAPMSGRPLHEGWAAANTAERSAMAREMGAALATLHEFPCARHGHVQGGDADGLSLETGPWPDVLIDRIETYRALSPSERFDYHFDEVTAAVEANRRPLADAPAALIHGDPAMPNVFRDDTGIGFVDWELACVGDPANELVRAELQAFGSGRSGPGDRHLDAFHAGYRDRAGALPPGIEDRRPVYEAVYFLTKSGYFDRWVEYRDESPDEFAAYVRNEMDRRLERIT